MLEWAKAIHEAIGIDSPRVFVGAFAICGLLLFGGVGWIIDRGYRVKIREQSQITPLPKPAAGMQSSPAPPTPVPPKPRPIPKAKNPYHPVISAALTTVTKDGALRRITSLVRLDNQTVYDTKAHIAFALIWDGVVLRPEIPPRDIDFAPQDKIERSSFANLSDDHYARFLNGSGKLTTRLTAEYDDRDGKTTYTFEGVAEPDSDHLNVIRSDHNYTPRPGS